MDKNINNPSWLTTWQENYQGKTTESKALESFLKKNYKGHSYVPWATMLRLMYMQDPEAVVEVVLNKDGDILHTSIYQLRMVDNDGKNEVERTTMSISSFVIVRATFLGKTFEEVYPVQDNAYNAPKLVDQNMINKALQRAKAKVIALATGIGFRLYEDGDLQFDVEENVKAKIEKSKAKETKVEKAIEAPTEVNANPKNETNPLVDYIINTPNIDLALERLNGTLEKKFGFTIAQADGADTLADKLKVLTNPTTTLNALKKIMETV